MQLPVGFTPATLDRVTEFFADEKLGELLFAHMGDPEAKTKIVDLESRKLIQFAFAPNGEPALFIASKERYATVEEHAFAEKLVSFWDRGGKFDSRDGRIITNDDIPPHVYRISTPEGEVAVVESVASKLLKLGLIHEHDGKLYGPSKLLVEQWIHENGVCDFCSEEHPKHAVMIPEFSLGDGITQSVGGWAACDTCHTMIVESRKTDLLRRAIEASSGGRFTAAALQGLHKRFWNAYEAKIDAAGIGAGLLDFVEDRINPEREFINPKLKDRDRRVEAIRRLTGLTTGEFAALERGDVLQNDVVNKLVAWRKKFGINDIGERKVAEMLNSFDRPLPPSNVPHWQVALDQKFAAINKLKYIEHAPGMKNNPIFSDLMGDLSALRAADAYSFSAETMHAILMGAQTIPHESTLDSVELPSTMAGWYWFAEPFPVTAAPLTSDTTAALLWSWDRHRKTPTLCFSAYVVEERDPERKGEINPSAKWIWPLEMSFHEMIALNTQLYRNAYGPGGPYANQEPEFLIGEEGTIKVVSEMSLFFLMSCVWFRQTVPGSKRKIEPKLTQTPGHIERHARKRYQREQKLKEVPTVRVIALRKSAVTEYVEPHTSLETSVRHLKVRFVVSGHPRLQPCGPGRKDKKLIWIDPYPKGPEDAPFKGPDDKVFAVVR
jgi:hypothetical protein